MIRSLSAAPLPSPWLLPTTTGKGGFYKLTDFGINGAFHLDSVGLRCSRFTSSTATRQRPEIVD
ncbi:hypothetical protein ACH4UM_39740 [Streptomyces sp. NPDC020801]|uniref:hypothetical protein n=1 Tax=unclassified Streptomyces TaxID=2593676 RepID=UPI003794A414